MYINSDNNPATGFSSWDYPAGSGTEYLLVGPAASPGWGGLFKHSGAPADWAFTPVSSFDAEMNFSAVKPVSGKNIIEFSVKKSASGFVNSALIELNSGWSAIGRIPQSETPEPKFFPIKL